MISRCTNKNQPHYKRYGGRGVTVDPIWMGAGGFEWFLAEVGLKPGREYSLERKKNEEGYRPGNVVWATRGEQARNQRSNVWVELDGERKILKDWAKTMGVSYKLASARILKGWSARDALLVPAGGPRLLEQVGLCDCRRTAWLMRRTR